MATRDPMGLGMALLTRLAGRRLLDRWGLRKPAERAVFQATKTGFRTLGAASKAFTAARTLGAAARLPAADGGDLFDLTPTEEQRLLQEIVGEFAAEQLRPAAAGADARCGPPPGLLTRSAELGLTLAGVPEELGGAGSERSQMTNVLVAEALGHGDMGLAVACLAPAAVSTALTLWGDALQQATYLPAFVGGAAATAPAGKTPAGKVSPAKAPAGKTPAGKVSPAKAPAGAVPAAALAVLEPRPLFDPFEPRTTARRGPGGYTLDGVKSLVPRAAEAELFVAAAAVPGQGPALFLVESDTAGLTVQAEPAMGLRAAGMARLVLDGVHVPAANRLGEPDAYAECVALSRLGWCALAVGTAQAVLDYVIPYVNERVAFGEPISHRQSVAFAVADIGTELDGMRLVTYRAAARAARGLPFAREVALARRLCAHHGMAIGSHGVQLLGGHGFVKEHPVQRWYRDLRAVALIEGGVLV